MNLLNIEKYGLVVKGLGHIGKIIEISHREF